MRAPSDPITLVESAYDLDSEEPGWLSRLASLAAADLGQRLGLCALRFDASDPARPSWSPAQMAPGTPPAFASVLARSIGSLDAGLVSVMFTSGTQGLVTASQLTGLGERFADLPQVRAIGAPHGAFDIASLKVVDPTGRGLLILVPLGQTVEVAPHLSRAWRPIGVHLAAGLRLRDALHRGFEGAEAILEADGSVAHAEGGAARRTARDTLREAVRRQDRARGPLRRRAPDEAVALWRGLVAGRWSLVDHFDHDGRRFVVARRNDPDVPDPRGLTLRERQVAALAATGLTGREIAYALGLADSTVSTLTRRAVRKLGLRHRGELLRILGRRG